MKLRPKDLKMKDCRAVVRVRDWHQNRVVCEAGDPTFCDRYRESKTKLCGNMDSQTENTVRFCQDNSDLDLSVSTKTVRPLD